MWKLIAASSALLLLAFWIFPTDDKLHTIKGKRVLITGASRGIGEGLAYEFAKLGASTVLTARNKQTLEKVVKKCKSLGLPEATHTAITADMLNLESISNLIVNSVKQLGGLDVVVLNHVASYIVEYFDGSKTSRENVYSAMDVNFKSYVEATGLVLPHLTKTEGNLVVLNSIAGVRTTPLMAAYSASKFALSGFFDSLKSQFVMEERNVSVTTCILGTIDTIGPNGDVDPDLLKARKHATPAPVNDTAFAIVSACANREDVMFYPPSIRIHTILYKFLSPLYDSMIRRHLPF